MSKDIQLGSFVVTEPNSSVQLFLALSVTLDSNTIHDDRTNLAQSTLKLLLDHQVHVTRGNGLQLSFDVLIAGDPSIASDVKLFADALCTAELWHQLNLQASLAPGIEACADAEQCESHVKFKVNVQHLRDVPDGDGQLRHRLLKDVPHSDIKPPAGVDILALQAVTLTIAIADATEAPVGEQVSVQRDRRRRSPMHRHDSGVQLDGDENSNDSDVDLFAESTVSDIASSCCAVTPSMSNDHFSYSQQPEKLSDLSSVNLTLSNAPGRPIFALLDVAVRTAMHGKSVKATRGFRLKNNSLAAGLACIAPILFSPGYQTAVAQRSCFIPTIAYATSNVCRRSRRDTFQSEGHGLDNQSSTVSTNSNLELNRISSDLYLYLQKTLYDDKASRKIKPIDFNPSADQRAHQTQELLLRDQDNESEAADRSAVPRSASKETVNVPSEVDDRLLDDMEDFDMLDDTTQMDVVQLDENLAMDVCDTPQFAPLEEYNKQCHFEIGGEDLLLDETLDMDTIF